MKIHTAWKTVSRTNIHDQASRPLVPPINSIAKASRPEKAPARVAAPKKRPTRYCNLWRGYHKDKLSEREHD